MSENQQLAQPQQREIRVVSDDSNLSYLFDTARFEHMYRIASAMAKASLIPKHLKGQSADQCAANCFLVVNQAIRWGMDPFALAPETYEVGGKLSFQGKLVAAVVNTRGNLDGRLSYEFSGTGENLTITVRGKFKNDPEIRTVSVSVKQARTDNQMWIKDPEQKLVYSGSIKWARRHCPEVVLGVITEEDNEITVQEASIAHTVDQSKAKSEQLAEKYSKHEKVVKEPEHSPAPSTPPVNSSVSDKVDPTLPKIPPSEKEALNITLLELLESNGIGQSAFKKWAKDAMGEAITKVSDLSFVSMKHTVENFDDLKGKMK